MAPARVRRPDRAKPRAGSVQVLDVQRARILAAMVQVVAQESAGQVTVARVVSRAGVSRRTFYDLFDDCEDCFLAVFEDAISRATQVASEAAQNAPSAWREQVRAGLAALLTLFDEEPALGSLLVVDALGAGPEVLQRRARVLETLAALVEARRSSSRSPSSSGGKTSPEEAAPPLVAEGVVGAVLSVIHARILARRAYSSTPATGRVSRATNGASRDRAPAPLIELLNPLMGVIVLPYLGPAAARRELDRPIPQIPATVPGTATAKTEAPTPANPLAGLNMRITYRTLQVLAVIANHPGASNRQIADGAGVHDQGQISKLLTRLDRLGLLHNTGQGQPQGAPNAWTLTPQGQQVQQALTVAR
jgi:AcrR family transcriptional regulator/DNA-binding MarR family transcriptional regulator